MSRESMKFADRDLKCLTCGLMFVFSAGEQQFFHERGFLNDPKRCKCKAKRLAERSECTFGGIGFCCLQGCIVDLAW